MSYIGDENVKLVVKNTFLEVLESCDEDAKKTSRRHSVSCPPAMSHSANNSLGGVDAAFVSYDPVADSVPLSELRHWANAIQPPRREGIEEATRSSRRPPSARMEEFPAEVEECEVTVGEKSGPLSCPRAKARTKFGRGVQMPPPEAETQQRTTIMLRNLPNCYSRDMLLELMDDMGFRGRYDFFYLPIDFATKASLGYAFVNLVRADDVPRFWAAFEGYSAWAVPTQKKAILSWTHRQGLRMNLRYYRNSAVMHASVLDEYKPVFLENGRRVAFPQPTQKIKAPRMQTERGNGREAKTMMVRARRCMPK